MTPKLAKLVKLTPQNSQNEQIIDLKLYFLAQAYPRIELRLLLENSFLYSKINKYMGLRVLDFALF